MDNCALQSSKLDQNFLKVGRGDLAISCLNEGLPRLCFGGFVYIIAPSDGDQAVKIGYTIDMVSKRLSGVQVGYWKPLEVYAAVGVLGADAREVERMTHKAASHRFKRLCGKWFEMTGAAALELVLEAGADVGAEMLSGDGVWEKALSLVGSKDLENV